MMEKETIPRQLVTKDYITAVHAFLLLSMILSIAVATFLVQKVIEHTLYPLIRHA